MAKYKPKKLEVEAIKITSAFIESIIQAGIEFTFPEFYFGDERFVIINKGKENEKVARVGDWVITEGEGLHRILSNDEFNLFYEPICESNKTQ